MITLFLCKCIISLVDLIAPVFTWVLPAGVQQAMSVLLEHIGHGFQFVGLFIELDFVWMVFDCLVVYFGVYIVRSIVIFSIGLFTGAKGE